MTNPVYHDIPYINLVNDVLTNGVRKTDRTGVGTIAVFGRSMRFDLSDGTIPLLTTKRMHIPSIIHEMLWYLQGTGNIKYLQDNGVRIWNEWSTPEGHLNKVYGFQWRNWEIDDYTSSVDVIKIRSNGTDAPYCPNFSRIACSEINTNDEFVGKRMVNNSGDPFTVVRKQATTNGKNSIYTVQFENTLSVVDVLRPNLRRGQVKDPYKITVFGQGCVGVYKEETPVRGAAYNMWYNMMRRCYDHTAVEYPLYGGRGVFVDQQWRCFSNFLRDIHNLVYFTKWRDNPSAYDLDKDYFGATSYGPNTCIFLPTKYNQVLPKLDGSKYIATNKHTGKKYEFTVQRWFARQHRIRHSQVISTALKESPTHSTRQWTFEKVTPPAGYVFRQQLYVDQIGNLVNELKTNPDSRRLLVSAWNVGELSSMALPPCHYVFQCITQKLTFEDRFREASKTHFCGDALGESKTLIVKAMDEAGIPTHRLSLLLNMRSNDVGLGNPFNIAQYSILMRMLCHVVNMVPGDFIYSGGDVHIYANHVAQLEEQVKRVPYPSPTLEFTRKVTNIDDFKFDDFKIVGYECHPGIKMQVAV